MPDFTFRDPTSGRTVTVRGSSMPTEAELEQVFASLPATATKPSAQLGAQGPFIGPGGGPDSNINAGDPAATRFDARRLRELDTQASQDFAGGLTSVVPFTPGAPDSGAGTAGRVTGIAALTAAPVMRLAGGLSKAVGSAEGLAAGVKAGAQTLANDPMVRFEATRSSLAAMGFPGPVATGAAYLVSGYRRGATGKALSAAEKAKVAADRAAATRMAEGMGAAGRVASANAPAATVVADAAARPGWVMVAGKAMSPQMVKNEVALAARRANATLSEAQLEAADTLVTQSGLSPVEAVLKLKAATKSVSAAAELAKRLGLPNDAEMQAQIASRQYKR